MAMMFIAPESASLVSELVRRVHSAEPGADATRPAGPVADVRITDFDDAHFRIEVTEEAPSLVRVSLALGAWDDLRAAGAEEHLRRIYGDALVAPHDGAAVTLEYDVATAVPAERAAVEAWARRVAAVRRHALAAPFLRAFAAVGSGAGAAAPAATLRLRPGEPAYVLPRADRVSVVFALAFRDDADRAMARVIAQELAESQRAVPAAPPVAFADQRPPLELRGVAGAEATGVGHVGWLTFSVFPRHWDSDAKREAVATQLALFRTYVDYHIKASKAQLHSRMRAQVETWLQVLNRAVPEDPFATKDKKTMGGRTFTRKG